MARIVVFGDRRRTQPLAIAGVEARVVADAGDAAAAWVALPEEVAVLILTPAVKAALESRLDERPDLLVTVLP